MVEQVSMDFQSALARRDTHRAYADQLEAAAQSGETISADLRAQLGPIFETFVASKENEQSARKAALLRLAAKYRSHADKINNGVNILDTTDEDAGNKVVSELSQNA